MTKEVIMAKAICYTEKYGQRFGFWPNSLGNIEHRTTLKLTVGILAPEHDGQTTGIKFDTHTNEGGNPNPKNNITK